MGAIADTPLVAPAPGAAEPRGTRPSRRGSDTLFGLGDAAFSEPVRTWSTPFLGRQYLINDPAGVKRVLVDNVANYPKTEMEQRFFRALFGEGLLGTDGEHWKRHRRIMAPAFQPSAVASYGPAMAQSAAAFAARWEGRNEPVDMGAEMSALTLRIISRTMFSTESPEVIDLIAHTMARGFEQQDFNLLDVLPVIGPMRMNARVKRMEALFRPLDDIVFAMIKERQQGRGCGDDLLARLVAATDGDSGVALTPAEVRDEVITIYVAGHETTAVAMSWIWFLLAQHPQIVDKLEAELDCVLGGRDPTQEDIEKLVYTRRIADEAMRLYPPAPGISARRCLADDEVAGVTVKRGAYVMVMPWVLHRHRELWDDPLQFDPDRWARPLPHRFAYLPFGAGPRICIGQLMAVNEILLILATLAQRFRVRLAPGASVGMRANITLRPLGLTMIVERRA